MKPQKLQLGIQVFHKLTRIFGLVFGYNIKLIKLFRFGSSPAKQVPYIDRGPSDA